MKLENEWLNKEIQNLSSDRKKRLRRKISDSKTSILFLLMTLIVFFCCTSLEAKRIDSLKTNKNCAKMSHGRQFTCPKCRKCQWQSSKNADWQGRFYCTSCNAYLGK